MTACVPMHVHVHVYVPFCLWTSGSCNAYAWFWVVHHQMEGHVYVHVHVQLTLWLTDLLKQG